MDLANFNSLNELFLISIEKHHKPDAFLHKEMGEYQGLSSEEALRKVAAVAASFESLGIRRGDKVAILSENRLEWALTDYALLGLGAIVVPIYPALLEPDIEYILRDSSAKGIVVSTDLQLAKALNTRPKLPELKFVIAADCKATEGTGAYCWELMLEQGWKLMEDPVAWFRRKALEAQPEDVATIIYTSGTMGEQKGVVLTHSNIGSNIRESAKLFPFGESDVGISFLPLAHIFERMLDYTYFWMGVSIAYGESFEKLPHNMLEAQPTVMAVVPRVLEKIHFRVMQTVRRSSPAKQRLFKWAVRVAQEYFSCATAHGTAPLSLRLKHKLADRLVCSKIREKLGGRMRMMISGAAPLAPDLARFFFAMGLPVYEGYGLTETSPVVSVNHPGAVKLETVGRIIPGVEVRLTEEIESNNGETGREILVRGPNVTPGYYRLDKENRESFVDGWFRTGDLGEIDSDGYLRITGRKKNLFKTSGGKYVAPEKLENFFQCHPAVSQIVVLGDKRPFVGALIVPDFAYLENYARQQGISFRDREELVRNPMVHAFIERQVDEATHWLPRHEKIRQIVLIPREFTIEGGELSPTQKIKRRVVEKLYRNEIEKMFQAGAPAAQNF